MLYGNRKENAMRIITGAILIVGAIWLFTSALPYGNSYGNMPGMIKLAFILAGLTAMLGAFYLFAGSVEAKENARWYQFTIKSILAVTVMVALFFSGRAMGLRESIPSFSSYAAPYSVPFTTTVSPMIFTSPASTTPVPIDATTPETTPPPASSGVWRPSQTPPTSDSKPTPSTPPNQEPDHRT
jgi:hypothetical protein